MPTGTCERYRRLWQSDGGPPDVFDFLDTCGTTDTREKMAVLLLDQRHRWQTDHPLKVEDYLARLPDMAVDPDARLQLAVGEFQARLSSTSPPRLDEFADRFTDISGPLRDKLSALGFTDNEAREEELLITRTYTEAAGAIRGEERIGRYRLVRVLGEGAFGRVYLGFDEQLRRQVAVKIPTAQRLSQPADVEAYLAEARTVAALDHPNIVSVYDVGRMDDGLVYIVSKFIEGRTLAERIKVARPSPEESAKLVATVAQALQHAHQRRLVHRDIKPSNILLEESTGTPYVVDFGLAIREEDYLQGSSFAGTPPYMSPEQARGEGHRLDGRSDIFSLGVVFYELLCGTRPFRGGTAQTLMQQIISVDPPRPRELDGAIPGELERICLRAIAKRASDRYPTAQGLADDLLHWHPGRPLQRADVPIVPKGIRSFAGDDAEFFLELLPGPRDREGLPDSLRFWKGRMEEQDPAKTFRVGLMVGPSGCGKSSLVKAGLIPRLSPQIVAVYVEATPAETEARILHGLRRRLPDLPAGSGLADVLAHVRRGGGPKVVVILDQFEQWLHAHRAEPQTELVTALRQCDGGGLQALVMVRDDFSMAASRFMRDLEDPIQEGHNFATVDLFDVDHAQAVLARFGQAFGKFPRESGQVTAPHREFVHLAVAGLANDLQVVPIRLALFAEMVKVKPWLPSTLSQIGGPEGVGVRFLEETFGSRSANPDHRIHQHAARGVLKALLPEVGMDLRGHIASHAELLATSGYQNRPEEFERLLRILDGELRLLTPTDPEGQAGETDAGANAKYYQLTHDFLVAAIRTWLTEKQRETRRGRAEIRLAERARLWTARREPRQLPSAWEWLNIRLYAARSPWSEPQRAMMRTATRHHAWRLLRIVCALAVLAGGLAAWRHVFQHQTQQDRIDGLVGDLWRTQVEHLPGLLDELQPHRSLWEERVAAVAEDAAASDGRRTRAFLALAREDGSGLDYLRRRMLQADAEQHEVLRAELRPWKDQLCQGLWEPALNSSMSDEQLIRAAAALADYAPDEPRWQRLAPAVSEALVGTDPILVRPWAEALCPVRQFMLAPLLAVYFGSAAESNRRTVAISVLVRFAERDRQLLDNELLSRLVLATDPLSYRILEPVIRQGREGLQPHLHAELRGEVPLNGDPESEKKVVRRAIALETLSLLGDADPLWKHLAAAGDPRVRTRLIDRLAVVAGDWHVLLERLDREPDPRIRHAIVLGCGEYVPRLSPASRDEWVARLLERFRTDPDAGVHTATEWLLRALGAGQRVEEEKARLSASVAGRGWSMGPYGLTLAHIERPGRFTMGSPADEAGRDRGEHQFEFSIDYVFAVSTTEVSIRQFHRYQPGFEYAVEAARDPDCPINRVTAYDAMKFCRWLSEQEPDFDKATCCYPPCEAIGPGMQLPADYFTRPGYRLPNMAEWECVARAGSRTSRFFGNSDAPLELYCWSASNARELTRPVGGLRPNPWGLFDIYGNVNEWCHGLEVGWNPQYLAVRGGDYRSTPRFLRSAMPGVSDAGERLSTIGFRVAKTLASKPGTPH